KNFTIALVVFALLSAVVFPYVRFYADNPDTFQYISISSKYLSGDWSYAINGYWSPLISWLLIIPSLFFEDILAFKLLQLFIGALLYITKAFGFPFFIVFILVVFSLTKSKEKRRTSNLILALGTFLFISVLWILPLSLHYNQLTISKVPGFNMSRDMVPLPNRSDELPVLGKGLHTPQANSISAWENPGDYVNHETISLFSSPSEYFQIVKRNFLSIYYFDFR